MAATDFPLARRPRCWPLPWALAALGLLVLAGVGRYGLASTAAPPPIETGTVERRTPDGPVRGCWAKVHLRAPGVQVQVTAPLPPDAGRPARAEATLRTVPAWAEAAHLVLAVNANFFSKVLPPPSAATDPGWAPDLPVDLVGLSVSAGRLVSPARSVHGRGDPALLILRDGRARIDWVTAPPPEAACAVAGLGPADDGKPPGTLLVTAGRNTGATARVQPAARHPRTAAGVTADGRTLILVVVDGRQPDYSVGVTLPELADILIGLGAVDALNLDGGGSSSFYYQPPDGRPLRNRPSGGQWRPVGNHLGVALSSP